MAITPLPTPPSRSDSPSTFADDADVFIAALPDFVTEANALATEVNGYQSSASSSATAASSSATAASASATAAASSANYKGEWSSLTGALAKPATVSHNGAFWVLLNNLANVTTSQPSPSNTDWLFSSGTRWVTYTASATLAKNSQSVIEATSGAADMTLPAMAAKDFVVLHNSSQSTQAVRLVNAGYTIRGNRSSITSSDNLVIAAGDTIHLVAMSSSILEAV